MDGRYINALPRTSIEEVGTVTPSDIPYVFSCDVPIAENKRSRLEQTPSLASKLTHNVLLGTR